MATKSQPGVSIFSPGTSHHQDRETSLAPSTASPSRSEGETSVSEQSPNSDSSSYEAESSGSEHDGSSSDDASDSDDDVDADDDGSSQRDALKRNDSKALAWLLRTAEERAICHAMERDEDTNLTQHILNSHGFYAKQSTATGEQYLEKRKKWISGWSPHVSWTTWPMAPTEVPRQPYRVWDTSVVMNEPWVPSRDLESEVFAYMLKRSRLRWKRWARQSPMTNEQVSSYPKTNPPTRKPEVGEERTMHSAAHILDSTENHTRNEEIVFSADDEKSWAVARPVVRSILTQFDSVLSKLHLSATSAHPGHWRGKTGKDPGSHRYAKRKRSTDAYNNLDRDWSHVLAMASIAGISPRVISRAAARCSAMFNETMTFQSMPETDANAEMPKPVTFTPADFAAKPQKRLGEQPRRRWELSEGCPIRDCRLYHREWGPGETMRHMRWAHRWDPLPFDLDFDAAITGMVGGVHVDGFLQPVPPMKHEARKPTKPKNPRVRSGAQKPGYDETGHESKRQKTETIEQWHY